MKSQAQFLENIQRLQNNFSALHNIFAIMLDISGYPQTSLSGDPADIDAIMDKIKDFSIFIPYVRELALSSLEDQIVSPTRIPGINIAVQAIRNDNRISSVWGIIYVTDPVYAELPEGFHTITTESNIYRLLEFIKGTTHEYTRIIYDYTKASAESIRSTDRAIDIEDSLKRSQVNATILKHLGSDSPIEVIFQNMLEVIGSYLKLSSAQIFKLKDSTMDLVSEWLAPGKISIIDKTRGIPRSTFFYTDSCQVINTHSRLTTKEISVLNQAKIKSTIIIPIIINKTVSMYATFNDCENIRSFQPEDIKLISNTGQVIQAILSQRIQKNSLVSSYTALEAILDNVGNAVYVVEKDSQEVLFANHIFKSIFHEDMSNGNFTSFIASLDSDPAKVSQEILYPYSSHGDWYRIYINEIKWVDGRPAVLYALHNITDKMSYQKKIEQLAYSDFLTGLLNRMCCERDLAAMVDDSIKNHTKGAILYIDLDDFKQINDGLGHQYGDVLLQDIALCFSQVKGVEKNCYRMGGDEFLILVSPKNFYRFDEIVEDLKSIFAKPWYLKDNDYYCTMSMGSVFFPDEGHDIHDLITKADAAMYIAKKSGKNKVANYSDSIISDSSRRLGLERGMRYATNNDIGEFEVYFQPIIRMDSKDKSPICCGAEALVRWNSPTLGFVLPSDFIPLAEYLGLITPIGKYVMEEACKACKSWNDNGHPDYKVNVNLSVVQLLQDDIVDTVKAALAMSGLAPQNLTLEVTESLAINDMDKMKKILGKIKSIGVRIALDDFGTGYSSLNHIREIPLDVIKIDQSFIKDLATSEYAPAFVNMVASLGKAIDVNICVEGIENTDQFDVLKDIPVSMIQGYLFDKPLIRKDFEEKYVKTNN